MKTFVKSVDESAWIAMEEGWPSPIDVDAKKNEIKRSMLEYATLQRKLGIFNKESMKE